ncbi:MAG: zinc metalloprotease [Candidatus Binatia bacterium]
MIAYQSLLEAHPGLRQKMHALEHATEQKMMFALEAAPKLVTIPVVVHVVYKQAAENISATQIKSQLAVLNRDFRATNPDKSKVPAAWKGLVTDAKVLFKLATRDPKGKVTTGITRTATKKASFGFDDSVKAVGSGGVAAWNTKEYLNIWVCKLSGGLLGYAQFPGGPAKTDGVVITHTAFGTNGTAKAPFNLGRTATHEIGHWLNLRHIWGDTEDCSGSDLAGDTPNCAGPNYGKPSFPQVSCGNAPNGDMFMNYMDYVDDAAMFMFTARQVARMRATLSGPRKTIVT